MGLRTALYRSIVSKPHYIVGRLGARCAQMFHTLSLPTVTRSVKINHGPRKRSYREGRESHYPCGLVGRMQMQLDAYDTSMRWRYLAQKIPVTRFESSI